MSFSISGQLGVLLAGKKCLLWTIFIKIITLKTKIFFADLNIQKLEIFFDPNLNFVKEFKLRGMPTTVLINKKGEEFARIIGEVNLQDKKFLKWLLKYD